MCNCGRRAAAAAAAAAAGAPAGIGQAGATPVTGRSVRGAAPGPVIHDPILWGPHMWTAMHTLSVFVPFASAKTEWLELLKPLSASLPCPECAGHYKKWLSVHPIEYDRRQLRHLMRRNKVTVADTNIVTWLLELHNAINGRKSVGAWTVDGMKEVYGGDVAIRREAVRGAINSIRGMVGANAIAGLEKLLQRM